MYIYNVVLLFAVGVCVGCLDTATDANRSNYDPQVETQRTEREHVNKSNSKLPIDSDCIYKLAGVRNISIEQGPEKAIGEYEKLLKSGCDIAEVRIGLGLMLAKTDRFEDASAQYRIVTERDPKNWIAHWTLAQTLILELGQYAEGLEETVIARELDDLGGNGHLYDYFLARAYEGLDRYPEALNYYKKFTIEQNKKNPKDERLTDARARIQRIEILTKKAS